MDATVRSFKDRIRHATPAIGMWVASGSPLVAEICAGSELDWLIIDGEHAPNDLRSTLAQLQAAAAYPIDVVVRVPIGDPVLIKQHLDIGATSLLVPMIHDRASAEAVVRAVRYPPEGERGVGSAVARSSRWNRHATYMDEANERITTIVQIESRQAIDELEEIASVDGIDAVFVGPADLAASLGHRGRQDHPEVIQTVLDVLQRAAEAGKPVGVNAFDETLARRYLAAGARFIVVGADVSLLAAGSTQLATRFSSSPTRESAAMGGAPRRTT